jgi:hypothetical protein
LKKRITRINKKIGDNDNETESKKAEPAINSIKKANKRKIIPQKTTIDINSVKLSAQKTRKLNPQPNLVTRTKESEGNQENADEVKLPTQDEKTGKSETMKLTKTASLSSIPIKNKFDVLPRFQQITTTTGTIKSVHNAKFDRGSNKKKK